jgi:uncharacterized repeat protein (TIGR01451 family)
VAISSATFDPYADNNSATALGPQVRLPDLSIDKQVSGIAIPGQVITYTLVYSNVGCVAAERVVVIDSLPEQVSLLSASLPPGEIDGRRLLWNDAVLDLGAAQAVRIELAVRVHNTAKIGDILTNTATITTSMIEQTPWNNAATAVIEVGEADLELAKSGPALAVPGALIDYVLVYSNSGSVTAKDVYLLDELPQGVQHFASVWQAPDAEQAAPLTPTIMTRSLEWYLGHVAPGASGRLTVTAAIDLLRVDGEKLINTAVLRSRTPERDLMRNSASWETVIQRADLWVTKSGLASTFPGQVITYRIQFGNSGTTASRNTVLTDTFPAELDLQSLGVTLGPIALTLSDTVENSYVWTLPDLEPGQRGWMDLSVKVRDDAGVGQSQLLITNTATIASSILESNLLNNVARHSTAVLRADVTLSKRVSPTHTVKPTDLVTFALDYQNLGMLAAEDVVITDSLPSELEYVGEMTEPAPTSIQDVDGRQLFTWDLGQVLAGETGQITLTARVQDQPWGPNIQTLTNTACITTTSPESALYNGCAAVTVSVAPGCPAALELSAVPEYLPADGVSEAELLLTAQDAFGNPVLDGTILQISTTRGLLRSDDSSERGLSLTRQTYNGEFMVKLVADSKASIATVLVTVIGPGEGCTIEEMGEVKITRTITFEAAALAISKTAWPDAIVTPGNAVTYTILYTNSGPGVAMSTRIVDHLPPQFIVDEIVTTPTITLTSTRVETLTWNAGDLPAEASGVIVVRGHLDASWRDWERSQPLSNCAAISSLTDDPVAQDNQACATLDVLTADLWVTKQAWQTDVKPGGSIAWRIQVGNRGPAIARNVVVTDTLPHGTVVSATFPSMPSVSYGDTEVSFPIGDLAPGEERIITLIALVSTDEVKPGQALENHILVRTDTYEFDESDNQATDSVIVRAPDLVVRLYPQVGPMCRGQIMTYLIAYENLGNFLAENVVITVTLDPELCAADYAGCPQELRLELGTVERGQSAVIPVRCRLPWVTEQYKDFRSTTLSARAVISSSSIEPQGTLDNNTATSEIAVSACLFLVEIYHNF